MLTTSRKLPYYLAMIRLHRTFIIPILLIGLLSASAFGQQPANLSFNESDMYEKYRDSLKNTPYDWTLPILGSKVRKLGFDLPYPTGIGFNYAHSIQDVLISELQVGFDPDRLVNVDNLARFREVEATVDAYVARVDFWLLPFINVFGLVGRIESSTNVDLGLPIDLQFQVNNAGTSLGWGGIVAGGIGPMVMSANFVQNWTWIGSLKKPSKSTIIDARAGYMHRFRHNPKSNIVFLVGAQYLGINANSSGDAKLEKLLGITPEKKQEASDNLDAWYEDLSDPQKEIFGGLYGGLSDWLNTPSNAALYYDFDKRLYYPVSMTLGANYQLNPRWNFNAVYTFLGSREQFVFGFNYRFGIKGKNLMSGMTF